MTRSQAVDSAARALLDATNGICPDEVITVTDGTLTLWLKGIRAARAALRSALALPEEESEVRALRERAERAERERDELRASPDYAGLAAYVTRYTDDDGIFLCHPEDLLAEIVKASRASPEETATDGALGVCDSQSRGRPHLRGPFCVNWRASPKEGGRHE